MLLLLAYTFLIIAISYKTQTLSVIEPTQTSSETLVRSTSSRRRELKETRTTGSPSTAIFLHVGYLNLWPDMLTCTRNAVAGAARQRENGKVDVFVSVAHATQPDSSKQASKTSFSNISISTIEEDLQSMPHIGDVVVKEFDNSGADVGPFIKMLAHEDIATRKYDYVLKMHSKGDNEMRDYMIKSLCGSPEQVSSILHSFEVNHEADMIAPKGLLFGPRTDPSRIHPHLVRKYNIIEPPVATFDSATQSKMNDIHNLMFPDWIKNHDDENKKIAFVGGENMVVTAGTMFWIRYSALHPRNLADALPTLDFRSRYTDNLGVEHAIERLFASEILLRERKIAAIAPPATTKLRGVYGGI